MITHKDSELIAEFCQAKLDLANAKLSDEYYYTSLPLCVIDAVFSIGVTYSSTRNVVIRFCDYFSIDRISKEIQTPPSKQLSITEFLRLYDEYGIKRFTEEIYCNRQRTSAHNGILKSEAVLRFSQILAKYQINYRQDVNKIVGSSDFEQDIKQIPGQKSGICLTYLYMLAGSDNYIKPDRMISTFVCSALNRTLNIGEINSVLTGTCKLLSHEYPHLTLRSLDHLIWNYQRAMPDKPTNELKKKRNCNRNIEP